MKFIPLVTLIISFCSISLYAGQQQLKKGSVVVAVESLRSDSGTVRVSLYSSKEGFPMKSEKALQTVVASIKEGRARAAFHDMPYGTYAAAVLHDENGNGRMDFSWMMFPREGFGASNIKEKRMLPPPFGDSKFLLDSEQRMLKVVVHY